MTEYGDIKIPQLLKTVMVFIDRVGFPVMAFSLMFCMAFFTLYKTTGAIEGNTRALIEFKSSASAFQTLVSREHGDMKECLVTIMRVK